MHFIGTNIGGASLKVAVMDECGEFCELFCCQAALARSRSRARSNKIWSKKATARAS